MTYILLMALILIEAGFGVFEIISTSTKKEWTLKRFLVSGAEIVLFLLMLFFPGIDTSFRFKGLIILLAIRLIFYGIGVLISRNASASESAPKKKGAKILSMLLSIFLLFAAMVPALIFRDYEGRPVTGPYEVQSCRAILIDPDRVEAFETDGSLREVPVYFFYPADVAPGQKLPLVLFSHGAFGYYQSNMSTYMELASNGYVVVSLDHPYHSMFTKDTAGKTITVDPNFINDVMTTAQNGTEKEIYALTRDWMDLRVKDVNFVLDSLISGAEDGETADFWFADDTARAEVAHVLTMIDTGKIGVMGHSMGGAAAVEIGKIRNDIGAVIDLDGTMLGSMIGAEDGKYIIEDIVYEVPLLEMENEDSHYGYIECRKIGYPYPNNMIRDNATTSFVTYFEGSLHMDYTDLPLFAPFLAKMLGSGDVDNGYMIDQVNRLALEFFDCYLKGEGSFSVSESYKGEKNGHPSQED